MASLSKEDIDNDPVLKEAFEMGRQARFDEQLAYLDSLEPLLEDNPHELHEMRVISGFSSAGTRIFLGNTELRGITSFNYSIDVHSAVGKVQLELLVKSIIIDKEDDK